MRTPHKKYAKTNTVLFLVMLIFVYIFWLIRATNHLLNTSFSNTMPTTFRQHDNTFSACLLIMDDNHFLIEWLAYHYHVLPLRHLILAVDPRSKTSPLPILNRWKKQGLETILWRDSDFMTKEEKQSAEDYVRGYFGDIAPNLVQHRARQRMFYFKCLQEFKRQNSDWVVLLDSDEYLHINYPTIRKLNLTAAVMDTQGVVRNFLEQELQRPGHNLSSPCVQIPRIRYGPIESPAVAINQKVPDGLNASHFLTMRWRYHTAANQFVINKISKTMIDVSRVDWDQLKPVDSIHRPIRSLCSQRRLHIRSKDSVFRIAHFLGTTEQFHYRDDPRQGDERSEKQYNKQATATYPESDDDLRPWLEGFVRDKGPETAKYLLRNVGVLE